MSWQLTIHGFGAHCERGHPTARTPNAHWTFSATWLHTESKGNLEWRTCPWNLERSCFWYCGHGQCFLRSRMKIIRWMKKITRSWTIPLESSKLWRENSPRWEISYPDRAYTRIFRPARFNWVSYRLKVPCCGKRRGTETDLIVSRRPRVGSCSEIDTGWVSLYTLCLLGNSASEKSRQ